MKEFELINVYGLELKVRHETDHRKPWRVTYFSLRNTIPWIYEKRGYTRGEAIDTVLGEIKEMMWEFCNYEQ